MPGWKPDMESNEKIEIKCPKGSLKPLTRLEWRKDMGEKVKPGDVILQLTDLASGGSVFRVKSICHGKVKRIFTPKSCDIVSIGKGDYNDNNGSVSSGDSVVLKVRDLERREEVKLEIKMDCCDRESQYGHFNLGYYDCDHTTFLDDICVECGYKMEEVKCQTRGGRLPNNAMGAKVKQGSTQDLEDRSEKVLVSAGFLSNQNEIKFNKSYVDEQEKSFIFELLYEKRKLSLVLDLDNTLIHATPSLPEVKSAEEFLDIGEVLKKEMNEETFLELQGSVVVLEEKQSPMEMLPAGRKIMPHYDDFQEDPKVQIYYRLIESLIFCIPFSGSNNGEKLTAHSWNCGFYKLRPGVINMLKTLSKDKYEIYMYTMGTEYHAYTSLRILDPELRFFHPKRIFYRNNGFRTNSIKSLSTLFPYDHRTLVILDDIEQAWTDINSLLKVYPYNFFPSNSIPNDSSNFSRYISQIRANNRWSQLIKKKRARQEELEQQKEQRGEQQCNERDVNRAPNGTFSQVDKKEQPLSSGENIKEMVRTEKDSQLLVFQKLLISIHEAYFRELETSMSKHSNLEGEEDSLKDKIYKHAPSLSYIIKIMRRNVLENCNLQFTGFNNKYFYDFTDSDLYKWCRYFGSTVLDRGNKDGQDQEQMAVTHCICEQLYTEKYYRARESGIPCNNILWLEAIIYTWIGPHSVKLASPLLNDPINSEFYTPFDVLNFDEKNSQDYIDLENYNYSYLYSPNFSESIENQLWEEAFDDVLLPLDESSDSSRDFYRDTDSQCDERSLSTLS
ncbi:NLI interacting factor-like phosphatase family protein [Cryptosporidium felis]|nr:NLI interacting factor-like phosphatase family protein [Cryptosporidium felis]